MTKKELVSKVSYITGLPKKDSKECIDACLAVVEDAMKNDEEVSLYKFGKFSPVIKEERVGINPATRESVIIPRHRAMKFVPSDFLKEEIYDI